MITPPTLPARSSTTSRPARRADSRTSVLVCRGCCCGTMAKHPDVDHARHLTRLRGAVDSVPGATLWTVDCLDACEHSNVVVVRVNGSKRWFGEMLADHDVDALADWLSSNGHEELPPELSSHVFDPESAPAVPVDMAPMRNDELIEWARVALSGGGGWSIGVQGALAEFDPTGATVSVGSGEIVASTPTGAMRLRFTDDTRAFFAGRVDPVRGPVLVVLASVTMGVDIHKRVTVLGPDLDAIDPSHRNDTLVDLGIGRTAGAFMIRSADPEVLGLIDTIVGLDWRDASSVTRAQLIEASPTRVVQSPIGRIEVFAPIPAADQESPDGAHTHLLPGDLARGEDLPFGIQIPKGFVPGAVHFPRQA